MAAQQLHDGNDEGVKMGSAATDKIGFYSATAVVQPAAIADATDAATAITKCNAVILALETLGLIASS
jgi:hypothetical protein